MIPNDPEKGYPLPENEDVLIKDFADVAYRQVVTDVLIAWCKSCVVVMEEENDENLIATGLSLNEVYDCFLSEFSPLLPRDVPESLRWQFVSLLSTLYDTEEFYLNGETGELNTFFKFTVQPLDWSRL